MRWKKAVLIAVTACAMIISGCTDTGGQKTIELQYPADGQEQVGDSVEKGTYAIPLSWDGAGYDTFDIEIRDINDHVIDTCSTTTSSCSVKVPPGQALQWTVTGKSADGGTAQETASFSSKRPVVFIHGWKLIDNRANCASIWADMTAYLENAGHIILDADPQTPGTQSICYDTGDALKNQHIPWIAAYNLQPRLDALFTSHNVPEHARADIVAHSMGGLASRVLIEHPGRTADWDETGWRTESTGDIDPKWSEMIHTLVMIGTPNHGTNTGIKETIGSLVSAEIEDMLPRSRFLDDLGYVKPEDKHYVSIGSTYKDIDTPNKNWRDYDGDGRKTSHDRVVPAESPYLANPSNFYILPGLAHSSFSGIPSDQVQYGAPAVFDLVKEELLALRAGIDTETDNLQLQTNAPMNIPARIHSSDPMESNIQVYSGEAFEFESSCSNEDEDHHFGEWAWSGPDEPITDRDYAQLQSHPWKKSLSLQFDTIGTTSVGFRCVDLSGTEDIKTWNIEVIERPDDPPYAASLSPTEQFSASQGEDVQFRAQCDNSEGDLEKGEWWRNHGSGWTLVETDTVQWNSDPWEKSRWFTMEEHGTVQIRFRCIDEGGQTSEVTWEGDISEAERKATMKSPSSPVQVAQGADQEFRAQCENPDQDVDRGEWWVKSGSDPAYMENQDHAQWQADPWKKSRTYHFENPGSYSIYFKCIYDDGFEDEVEWEVNVS